jgi:hypothetical protein
MNITVPHRSPVAWMALGLFGLVAWATQDRSAGLFVFAGLCLSLVVVWPLAALVRWICLRFGVPTGWRRAAMMLPVIAVSYWVFSGTNAFGGYQRGLLSHGLTAVPADTSIVAYEGRSGLFGEDCTMTIRCSASSLQTLLRAPQFSQVTDEQKLTRLRSAHPSIAPQGELAYFERADWKLRFPSGIPRCDVVTDSSFTWAFIDYAAGN